MPGRAQPFQEALRLLRRGLSGADALQLERNEHRGIHAAAARSENEGTDPILPARGHCIPRLRVLAQGENPGEDREDPLARLGIAFREAPEQSQPLGDVAVAQLELGGGAEDFAVVRGEVVSQLVGVRGALGIGVAFVFAGEHEE